MATLSPRSVLYLFLDVAILVVGLLNVPAVLHRAASPFDTIRQGEHCVVGEVRYRGESGSVAEGDVILQWNGIAVKKPGMAEFLADRGTVGDIVEVTLLRNGSERRERIVLVPHYPTARFAIITVIVALILWGTGVVVLVHRPDDLAATALHWSLVLLSATVLFTQGSIAPDIAWTPYARLGLWCAYIVSAASFLYFTMLFPRRKVASPIWSGVALLIPAIVLAAATTFQYIRLVGNVTAERFGAFSTTYDVYQAVLMAYGAAVVVNFAHSYRTSRNPEDRRRLRLVLWGIIVGSTPFLTFILLPQVAGMVPLIPEEYTFLALLATPLTLAISFVKYRLLDVNVLVRRSIVHGVLWVLIGVVYVLTVLAVTSIFGGENVFEGHLVVLAVAFVVAVGLAPARSRLLGLIDETLFPLSTNYQRILATVTGTLRDALTVEELYDRLVRSCADVIPCRSIAVYNRADGDARLFAVAGELRKGDDGHRPVIRVPVRQKSGKEIALLVVEPRVADERWRDEELSFLQTAADEAGAVIDRLLLLERIILEREARRKSEELGRQKTLMVSSVAHELRTPLTAIRLFAESLQARKHSDRRREKEYLKTIEGESERLTRMVDTVLDNARIEQGVKTFSFRPVDVRLVLRRSLRAMAYLVESHRGRIAVTMGNRLQRVRLDPDAMEEALINLLTNALKYSPVDKNIRLSAVRKGSWCLISVKDRGMGISREDLPNVFDPMYRSKRPLKAEGMGLGLSLVRNIVEAHGGTVRVSSTSVKGSTFEIKIPVNGP